jgi:hypothetical protein
VANRGEIPIRIFRTAHELSLHTIAIYSYEDRQSQHRQKADEAYQIGTKGQFTPVGAYLAGDEIIKIALEHGADLIHPGYGFLSENAEFAKNVEKAGLIVSLLFFLLLSFHFHGIITRNFFNNFFNGALGLFWSSRALAAGNVTSPTRELCGAWLLGGGHL